MDNTPIIHVYFMPGMAASSKIFDNIKLPKNQFQIHLLEWLIPFEDESLTSYVSRLSAYIKHENVVLIGVSFGGVIVQELSKVITCKKLIIVSSVKSKYELPKRMKFARRTKIYKLAPTHLANNIEKLSKYAFGKKVNKRIELYKKYLSVNDERYLNWAIENMICWNQEKPQNNVVHIHGDADTVFPIKNIQNCRTIKGGTHVMILNKYRWFNKNLPDIILQD
ncbi:alpha/beta hydrolase [Tamlana sp. 62-3]|uniref:Alpha/beta hydrolase n=1 Tax=Neotamlana sargassicola TaxID=2883125 RepID=A0A9X1I9G1_9FLAO|nr:alpha/beta hydrolase [Tamlana sargassicola]MCB4808794.1 alpha/beta hydrolase [Tamlana sargassicola]